MLRQRYYLGTCSLLCFIALSICGSASGQATVPEPEGYGNLVRLFDEFLEFGEPEFKDGVPDYTVPAMQKQQGELKAYQDRLRAIDIRDWPVSNQVDYHLVRAAMNRLDFFHRVLKPWARDPLFYMTSQSTFGPSRSGRLRLRTPIPDERLDNSRMQLRAVPKIFEQAKGNLSEAAHGLVFLALRVLHEEIDMYKGMVDAIKEHHPELVADAERALAAVIDYGDWLKKNQDKMNAPTGVGVENYNWWVKNVHLLPYTWQEEMDIVMHEDYRMVASLMLEKNRNRNLPPLDPVSSQAEYKESVKTSIENVMSFLRDEGIHTVQDYLVTDRYIGSWQRFDRPWPEKHNYFFNFSHRESLMEETHEMVGHAFDGIRFRRDTRPIRGKMDEGTNMIRTEGWAFWLEEMLMHAGYLDDRPRRAREVAYEQAIFRTVRAVMDLRMHDNSMTIEEAIAYGIENAPQGELLADTQHLWAITQDNLRYVGWHSGMVIGKFQLNKLIRDVANQRGDDFNLREFMDEFLAAGRIPFSLIRWEMTGLEDEIKKLW